MDNNALAERLEKRADAEVAAWHASMGMPFPNTGTARDLVDLLRAAGAHLRSVTGKQVAEITINTFGAADVKFADGSEARDNIGRKLYDPQPATPATVTDEDVKRITDVFLAHTGQAHKVTQLQRDLARPCMRAALESFANKEPTDE